jgi:GNAT superfamily N-acetyltransferase
MFSRFLVSSLMKLTIIRLFECSAQDEIDLAKIWPEYSSASLTLDNTHRIYAAKFNDRLLGAVRVTLADTQGALDSLRVREITRRRGVGQYLIEEVIRDNRDITGWWMADVGIEDREVMTAFMQALGFKVQDGGWEM